MATPEVSKGTCYQLILGGFQSQFRDEHHPDLSLDPGVLGIDADVAHSLSESPPIVRLRVTAKGKGLLVKAEGDGWRRANCLLAETPPAPEELEPHTIPSERILVLVDFGKLSQLRSLLNWKLCANSLAYHFERPKFNQVLSEIAEELKKRPADELIDPNKKWRVCRSMPMSLDTILSQLALIEFVVGHENPEKDKALRGQAVLFFKIFHDRIRPQRKITNLQALSLLSFFTGEDGFKITSLFSQYSTARGILLHSLKAQK